MASSLSQGHSLHRVQVLITNGLLERAARMVGRSVTKHHPLLSLPMAEQQLQYKPTKSQMAECRLQSCHLWNNGHSKAYLNFPLASCRRQVMICIYLPRPSPPACAACTIPGYSCTLPLKTQLRRFGLPVCLKSQNFQLHLDHGILLRQGPNPGVCLSSEPTG